MKNFLSSKGGWIAILPCTAAVAAYLFLVFLPGMREIHQLRADMVVKQRYLSESAVRAAREKAVETEEAETREYLQRGRNGAGSKAEGAALFGELSEQFRSAGVTMTMFRPEPKSLHVAVDRLPATVQCQGTFLQLQSLLASLEQLRHRIWIEELLLERGAEIEGNVKCELRLAIFVDNFEISD